MGAHSTLMITRSRALEYLRDETPTDDELARELDARLYNRLYNCVIVDDSYEDNDDGVL
jgi:deoxyhypusine synthase